MNNQDLASSLNGLVSLEMDCVEAYGQAMDRIDDHGLRQYFSFFRDQHKMQADHLNEAIRQLGGTPRQRAEDRLSRAEGFRPVEESANPQGLLETMRDNERLGMQEYDKARRDLQDLPMDIKAMLFDNFKLDQYHHLTLEKAFIGGSIWGRESR